MEHAHVQLTTPVLADESALWFSAYGFGWGYCGYELKSDVVCQYLGAANDSPKQLLLAFQLGKPRLSAAAERKAVPSTGERVELTGEDLGGIGG
ncbi:hypothetical protein BCh11DRAFT_03040 [Burkholderia sp. Ch1-1]|uniref:Uncharacterized protein n=1 Tax=Paraburkholderia dioscoreae TaxID=2604047 RepID=A0A5Q4ZNP4_9BURK|nr:MULTISPECIES: hypothetical protein [Paraburkholderia]EIF35227.1 hypothetical protein BCh11DRAFT_03040 [Burkholderia sp. Ch1-1]MDR8401201.1 hypothetical protein [Paraburkholderia sp. USG1]VVD34443.1 conserved protein of unknown function [Paraburkholderia dioscoreae]